MRSQPFIATLTALCLAVFAGLGLALLPVKNSTAAGPVLSVTGALPYAEAGSEATYHIELLNHTNHIVYDGVISITLPAGFSYVPSSTLVMGQGWPLESREPLVNGQTLTWGPYHLPAAGITAHNPYGIHTLMHDCQAGLHLDGAKTLVGNGGYVKQVFYGLDASTTGPSDCAVNFVNEAYARNLIPIIRLQGHFVNGVWQAPNPGLHGNYAEIAQAYARYVAGLPRRNTNPIYIEVWNEPDLWIEWSHKPNATQYARFFVAVSNAIRQLGDARIRVINGALTPGNMAFLRQMLNVPGFKDAFDAWSTHCYPYNHPASYNIHNGTARYGTYAIDCYIHELNVINSYGRRNIKVIISETGYALGSNTFKFEGFPSINESNRANYITSAFANYWQKWPEVIAVTPFQMTDTDGQWDEFDWIFPQWPFTPHLQYTSVSNLVKPVGSWKPYGYQINFRATISPTLAPGLYPGQLSGSERRGNMVQAAPAVTATVLPAGTWQYKYYFPIIMKSPPQTGPWYLSVPEHAEPGAIVPTHFLQPTPPADLSALTAIISTTLVLNGTPQQLALDEKTGLGAIILADPTETSGSLQIFALSNAQPGFTIFFDTLPQRITAAQTGYAYVSLANGLALIDLQAGRVIRKSDNLGRIRGMAHDAATGRLFAVNAEHDQLLVLHDDLTGQIAAQPLTDQPDQVLFDPGTRRLFIAFPAISQIKTLNADTLQTQAQTRLTGGPIVELALDPSRRRLYVLHALAPSYRGISVLETPLLRQIALVAGVENMPLQRASAITLTPNGDLLLSEADGLWQVDPNDFAATLRQTTRKQSASGGLRVGQEGTIYALNDHRLEVYR